MTQPLCVKDEEQVPYFRPTDLSSALAWLADHAAIAEACHRRDVEGAVARLKQHLSGAKHALLGHMND